MFIRSFYSWDEHLLEGPTSCKSTRRGHACRQTIGHSSGARPQPRRLWRGSRHRAVVAERLNGTTSLHRVLVMMANPSLRAPVFLLSPKGRQIEEVVGVQRQIESAL